METISKKTTIILLIISILCLAATVALAQGPGFDDGVEDVSVPFDGGVSLVAAAAAGYGIKKLRNRKKEK